MTSGRFYNLIFLKVVAVPCKRVAWVAYLNSKRVVENSAF